jgi:hypothetical protein
LATYSIRRFADPDALKRMQKQYLLALLLPHGGYFAGRGLVLSSTDGAEINHQALADILLNPDDGMPQALVDALYYVNEMATTEGMDRLLSAAAGNGIVLDAGAEMTPADVAVQVWLKDRGLFERQHAEQFLLRPRSFESFQLLELPAAKIQPSSESLAALESDLDDWFETKKRGRGSRVFAYPRGSEVWFLVRHGQPFKREGTLKGKESSSVYYRPEKHDVVVYNQALGELRVNAESKGEKDLYRAKFGLHLLGSEHYFPGKAKYTLEPLRHDGEASLVCNDVDGMEWAKLTEIRYYWGGAEGEVEIRRAEDIFAALRRRKGRIPEGPPPRIVRAAFKVKFTDSKTPRSVCIRPSNIAEYTRDDDGALVEQWLTKRGFILAGQAETDEETESVLAGS